MTWFSRAACTVPADLISARPVTHAGRRSPATLSLAQRVHPAEHRGHVQEHRMTRTLARGIFAFFGKQRSGFRTQKDAGEALAEHEHRR